MIKIAALCFLAVSVYGAAVPHGHFAQHHGHGYAPSYVAPAYTQQVVKVVEVEDKPQPYDFGYSITDKDGNSQGRQESGDAQGNVVGAYSLMDTHGVGRTVKYTADGYGFKAVVDTNEAGTASEDAADAQFVNSKPAKQVYAAPAPAPKKVVVAPSYHSVGYAQAAPAYNTYAHASHGHASHGYSHGPQHGYSHGHQHGYTGYGYH